MIGRSELLRFVRECVPWTLPGEPLPMTVLLGPAGSGKTTTLRAAAAMTEHLHGAYVDVEAQGYRTVSQILTALVFQLSTGRRRLGRLAFPRFLLGQLVVQLDLPVGDPHAARNQVAEFLAGLKRLRLSADIRALTTQVVNMAAPLPDGMTDTALTAVEVAFRFRRTPGERWWGTGPQPVVDALVDLHRRVNRGTQQDLAAAEERLCRAFLADLLANYSDRFWGPGRSQAAVALLDNVHSGAGAALLSTLAGVRNGDRIPDPLLVVAASGRLLPGLHLPPTGDADHLNLAAWRGGLGPAHRSGWYHPVRLRDLSDEETSGWDRLRSVYDDHHAPAVHRLTAGHPSGTDTLLAVASDTTLHQYLDGPDDEGRRVANQLLAELLVDVPAELHPHLVTCSAARDLRPAALRVALGDAAPEAAELHRIVADRLWLAPVAEFPTLHPWLRRLLLLALEVRPEGENGWAAVHIRLRDHWEHEGDRVGAWHHDLASHDGLSSPGAGPSVFETVVTGLDEALPGADPHQWLADLGTVTAAPNRLPRTAAVTVASLAGWAALRPERLRAVARLVAGLWLASDPLRVTPDAVSRGIAAQLTELGRLEPACYDTFFTVAENFRGKAETHVR